MEKCVINLSGLYFLYDQPCFAYEYKTQYS